jgi:hypothetical protein
MAYKSFEQQVQESLGALRMKPDAAVWLEVERALHKEKKRRWLIWFLLLAGTAGAFFGGYYRFSHKQGDQQVATTISQGRSTPKEQSTKPTENSKEKNTNAITSIKQERSISQENINKQTGETRKEKNMTAATQKTTVGEAISSAAQVEGRRANKIKNNKQPGIMIRDQPFTSKEKIKEDHIAKTEKNINRKVPGDPAKFEATDRKTVDSAKAVIESVTLPKDNETTIAKTEEKIKEPQALVPETITKNDTVATVNKNKKKSKWQWGLSAEIGSSGLRDPLNFSKALFVTAAPPASPGSGTAQAQNVVPQIKDAFSTGIQLEASRPLGKKHSIGLSLGYALFQTKTSVGKRIDSTRFFNFSGSTISNSNGYYYASTDSVGYINHYHFLQLGADLYTPFRLFKALSFRWQLGTGLNFLIATNGLHYDAGTGRLFRNPSLFVKTQTYLSTGFDVAIGRQPFLYVGPHWLYSMAKLSKQTGADQHLILSAIKISVVLPKKKK